MRHKALWILPLAIVLLAAASQTANKADMVRRHRVENHIRYLPSPEVLRVGSFGYDAIVADFLWLKLILYYGESRKGEHELDFFEELANTVVSLDPLYKEGYRFSALVLSQDMGDSEAGIRLLERGMRAMPNDWWLPFEAGFIEYVTNMDDEQAYRWFKRAADVPGAPEFPRRFAAFVASRAGDLEVSVVLYKTIAETTTDKHQRQDALEKVAQLEAAIRGEAPIPDWAKRKRVIGGRADKDA